MSKEQGKFVDLPGAKEGEVVVRFPPEASGYLHIGHAKAVLLNQHYRDTFKGKLIMRFDDTNPAKENAEFERIILEDLELLGVKPDRWSHSSDFFDDMLQYCEQLIREGKAYVDDSDSETMRKERELREDPKARSNDVKTNLSLWEEMKKGSKRGQECAVRAKIDMKSDNGCLRDPTIYRCKPEIHVRTGDKYKVYPTYDFTCPIVDSVEGVTHALRTTEYMDRDDQYYWFIDALKLRKPFVYAYSRLNMTNTVMSKRKLTWLVDQGHVQGWDDPRFPTVRGIMRRGMTVEGLKQFIVAQGSSRAVVMMDWDKIWAFNKKVIDPIAPRFTALESKDLVPVKVNGSLVLQKDKVAKHPKNLDVGTKEVWFGPEIFVEQEDARQMKEGTNVTFINWGNLKIGKIKTDPSGKVYLVEADLNLSDKDFKKTMKVTWIAQSERPALVSTVCVHFDHIISKAVLGKDEDFKNFVNPSSKKNIRCVGEPALAFLKKGEIIQLQRKGFFICDQEYVPSSPYSGAEIPLILISVPDGRATAPQQPPPAQSAKQTPVSSPPVQNGASSSQRSSLLLQIQKQGEQIRELKTAKADKAKIKAEVDTLLKLKNDFKAATGEDWTPALIESLPKTPSAPSSSSSGSRNQILRDIQAQGDKIRDLKAAKADKAVLKTEVEKLLKLKADFKSETGEDWNPKLIETVTEEPKNMVQGNSGDQLLLDIQAQGNKIREMKAAKASKDDIGKEVQTLKDLKTAFKEATGKDWNENLVKEVAAPATPVGISSNVLGEELAKKVDEQGNKVRDLKSQKADKAAIDEAVSVLLALKAEYKAVTGMDLAAPAKKGKSAAPKSASPEKKPAANGTSGDHSKLILEIKEIGDNVRKLKADKAAKPTIDAEVAKLLAAKEKYKQASGEEWNPNLVAGAAAKSQAPAPAKPAKKDGKKGKGGADGNKKPQTENADLKKQTKLGMEITKEENFSEWYSQMITKAEMIEYYDVSGCYVLRPWSFAIWESISRWFDDEIKKMGVSNVYFPMFVSQAALEREKTHIADFAPEVAWVTKSGDSEMAEPIAIRPTSETVMYPTFAKWVQSYRDLPIRVNQWCNVVRWEFKHPTPFLRTREFLWQEGHTAFSNAKDAQDEVYAILDLYARIYTDLLAVPVIKGRKTEKEKFAGGDFTTTVEAYIPMNGRGIQGATSHHLGQNFSKMFEIVFEDPETQKKEYAYQNSWGVTTRTIGVFAMIHGDNRGLVLPPRVAKIQAIVIPCGVTAQLSASAKDDLYAACKALVEKLVDAGFRAESDLRDNYSPGWKFNHWELKGVPIRIELGPRDVGKGEYVEVQRHSGEKRTLPIENLCDTTAATLQTIHTDLYTKAEKSRDEHICVTEDWNSLCTHLEKKFFIMSPFCGAPDCEDKVKKDSAREEASEPGAPAMGAKSLCIPFTQPKPLAAGQKCVHPKCGKPAQYYTLFGRSY